MNNSLKTIEIWQLASTKDISYAWMKWSFAKNAFNPDDYEKIYECTRENIDLNLLYQEFNTNHPADFKGHSLSVSDIISIKTGENEKIYYIDSIGFKEISDIWNEKRSDNYCKMNNDFKEVF